ncbi:hypothetical protein [Spirosoma areae]
MTSDEKKFIDAQQECFKRMDGMANGGTIPCEYHGCSCSARRQITALTMSCIVTPDIAIELVCQQGAEHFMIKHGRGDAVHRIN